MTLQKIFSSLSDYIKFDYCLLMLTQANNVMFLFHVWPFLMKLTPARNEDGLLMKFKMKFHVSFLASLTYPQTRTLQHTFHL